MLTSVQKGGYISRLLDYAFGKVDIDTANITKLAAVSTRILKSGDLIFLRFFVPSFTTKARSPNLKVPDSKNLGDLNSKYQEKKEVAINGHMVFIL